MADYDPAAVERAAQEYWRSRETFRADPDPAREKFYCLSMFPYPSGNLHMGHVRNYTIGDVISRHQRMLGKNVLQPMGWDAFGLPAENAAIKHGEEPARWTENNIRHMRGQLERLGFAYDWSRELATCRPDYYRWEQWLLTRLYQKDLLYRKSAWVNWDPVDRTVLANEQVIDGKGWRSGAPVERRRIPQWFIRITAYADELLDGLDRLDGWPEAVKTMQRNWIGRSEGLRIEFELADGRRVPVFTTRADTLAGVAALALAPEHPLVEEFARDNARLAEFVESCRRAPAAPEERAPRGVDTGARCRHPLSGAPLPVWCADFVLAEYGSGAVMTTPAHDQRDWNFARAHGLPLRQVVRPADGAAVDLDAGPYLEKGVVCDSGRYDGLASDDAIAAVARDLGRDGRARPERNYRLRDWGVSRQRRWGCPMPMRTDGRRFAPVADDELPFHPDTAAPLVEGLAPDTDTLDTFVESSWYYARFACARCDTAMLDEEAGYWLPVDQYIGGVEHAILHLLYARFFHKLLRDFGLVSGDEPFTRLLTQGMVVKDGAKMSKSRGNTVDPDALIRRYGADTVRLFVLFAAPPAQNLVWSDAGVEGASRFLRRLWRGALEHAARRAAPGDGDPAVRKQLRRETHRTVARVGRDFGARHAFNTGIAACMELLRELLRFEDHSKEGLAVAREAFDALLKLLAPVAPHICQHLWERLGHADCLAECAWPEADDSLLQEEVRDIVVQVDGKLRARLTLPADSSEEALREAALADAAVRRHIGDAKIKRVVCVPGRLVNIVL